LLADTERKLSEAFGTYGEKKFMGRTYMGNHRMTFLIDEKGKIKKIFPRLNLRIMRKRFGSVWTNAAPG
jgi:peroxiredoxin Q/BCP